MAGDNPTTPHGIRDMSGKINLNTGFIIVQQHPIIDELMEEWINCPNGKTWPECESMRWDWKHEQGAFSSFIRYDERFRDHIKTLPCMEANGYDTDDDWPFCHGHLVSHNWDRKKKIPKLAKKGLASGTLRRLHAQFLERQDQHFRIEKDFLGA
jgi:hypothetical protein